MSFLPFLHRVCSRQDLLAVEAQEAMSLILEGFATTPQIAAFLSALHTKGETSEELYGFALAMRERSAPIPHGISGEPILDTCGTGGDGCSTFNISTVAAFVTAGAGVKTAKHGNRSISSRCGSADVLESLGVDVTASPETVGGSLRDVGIGFLFAPQFHPAMRYAQPARLELKMRTVFNLLGPLVNPARADAQLIGASTTHAAELMAGALARLGTRHAFVVHGLDGLDEVSTTGPTIAFQVEVGSVNRLTWNASDFGLPTARIEDLAGGESPENAGILRSILQGDPGPRRDIVVANAAAALLAAEKVATLREGVATAVDSIDSGAAAAKLEALRLYAPSHVT